MSAEIPDPRLAGAAIAALRADSRADVQALMADFAAALETAGRRVAGVVQVREAGSAAGRPRIVLRDLRTGARYPISQDLGPGSVACNLDAGELALACASVERAAREGADLVVLSKFAKQEAQRGGLCDAFRAAMSARIPVLASVSPYFLDEWRGFAGRLAEFVAPERAALEEWWARARRPR